MCCSCSALQLLTCPFSSGSRGLAQLHPLTQPSTHSSLCNLWIISSPVPLLPGPCALNAGLNSPPQPCFDPSPCFSTLYPSLHRTTHSLALSLAYLNALPNMCHSLPVLYRLTPGSLQGQRWTQHVPTWPAPLSMALSTLALVKTSS